MAQEVTNTIKDLASQATAAIRQAALLIATGFAPAPMNTYTSVPPTREGLIGTWKAKWGTVSATFTLRGDGSYECEWPGAKYVGSWGLDKKSRLWITESCRPDEPSSWN